MIRMAQHSCHPARPRRLVLGLLTAAVTIAGAASIPLAARAATPPDPAAVFRALGLTVITSDGYVAGNGPAAAVKTAAASFADTADVAFYTGDDETGTGTIMVAVDPRPGEDYVELQDPADIASVQDGYTDPFGIYTDSGTREDIIPAGTAENITPVDAVAIGSPGVLSGNVIQVPAHIPINVCGNSIDIIGLVNPNSGNVCVNK